MEIDRKNGAILMSMLPEQIEKIIISAKKNVIFQNHFSSQIFSYKCIWPIVAAAAAAAAAII